MENTSLVFHLREKSLSGDFQDLRGIEKEFSEIEEFIIFLGLSDLHHY
jgi:hypothetical protein